MTLSIKSPSEIDAMRESGRILATILAVLKRQSAPGLTPRDMSAIAKAELKKMKAEPAFLNFFGYPDIICISVNDKVQHSIPDATPFKVGDVVNYDFGVRYKGMITDAGITVYIGDNPDPDVTRLIKGTELALNQAIKVIKHGVHVGDVSAAIERVLRKYKLGIVRELVGHGVGYQLHEDPEIPNYGRAGTGPILKSGMTIAVEPITTLGDAAIVEEKDGWTLRTQDGSLSAQFEHTILVTPTGCEVLTKA